MPGFQLQAVEALEQLSYQQLHLHPLRLLIQLLLDRVVVELLRIPLMVISV